MTTHELWVRIIIALIAILASFLVAKLVDRRLAKRHLAPGTITRYKILRQSILWSIVFIGVLSALLVIPQVRGIAAGILASSAVIGLVLGFAAQRTIGNFIAGLLIAFTQPIRLGDEIEFAGTRGVVEEVGLIYTWVRTPDADRLVIPNEKLVSETVRNSTIRNDRRLAEITVQVPVESRPARGGHGARVARRRGRRHPARRERDDRRAPLRRAGSPARPRSERPPARRRRRAARGRDLRQRGVESGMARGADSDALTRLVRSRRRKRLRRKQRRRRAVAALVVLGGARGRSGRGRGFRRQRGALASPAASRR